MRALLAAAALCALACVSADSPAFTYLWHLQQPIYWPDYQTPGDTSSHPTYQRAWDSIQLAGSQGNHPQNDLASIFSKADRVAVYQSRASDCANGVAGSHPSFGAQMTFPGDLVDNVNSLAKANQYGYSAGWNGTYANAVRTARTSAGSRRLDVVQFPYHHTLGPLVPASMLRMQLAIQDVAFKQAFSGGLSSSRGMFPAEMAFTERMIPTLAAAGVSWVIVANNHLSRACANYTFSPAGDNNDPPNAADQTNPAQANWFTKRVDRGCQPNNAVPFAFQPHYAVHTDAESGNETRIIVVPSAMAMSWSDSESCYSTSDADSILAHNDPARPMLFLLAHDGDNAFSGGYSYYMQCVSQLANEATGKGYQMLGVEDYLAKYPVPQDDVVHVEDGAWINHDGDFGDPQFIWGWMGIPRDQNGTYNITGGWDCNLRNWAVIVASQNWVDTAEQVAGGVRVEQVQLPGADATPAEVAWHFHAVEPSGWMYYGCPNLDMQDKPTISANRAIEWASKAATPRATSDKTGPTMLPLQRHPWNPGACGAGAKWKFKYTPMQKDFYVYTMIYDISDVEKVELVYRVDKDGRVDHSNKLLAPEKHGVARDELATMSDWTTVPMDRRPWPRGDYWNVQFDFNVTAMADQFTAHLTDLSGVLVDYYVTAADTLGNTARSELHHVYVGDGSNPCTSSS